MRDETLHEKIHIFRLFYVKKHISFLKKVFQTTESPKIHFSMFRKYIIRTSTKVFNFCRREVSLSQFYIKHFEYVYVYDYCADRPL